MSNVVFELFAKLGLDSSEYEKGLGNAKSLAGSVGGAIGNGLKTMAKVGVAAIGTASAAVGAFAASSVKTGAEFDKSMSQVAATMGKTMDEMQNEVGTVDLAWGTFSGNLREYAQEMGKNTAFSATEAADALNYMALAGYDTQTSMEMLPNVLNLAAAGSMDLARASDMVTDTQTAFGISLERTSQMVDEMAKAASTGNTSVEQLGDAFLVVGGLAQEMNGGMVELSDGTTATYDNVQELEIALTAMANAGIKGSEAGTHMRNMLLKLASPTEDGYKAFTQLGVSVFDSEGKMRSLAGIMQDLDGAMANLTQEEKLQAISDIFNTRDTAAAEALLNAVGEDWSNIAESILDADGAAQKMADTQLDNLAGDVTLFKSALEGAKIAVSDGLTPTLREFVQFGTDGLSRITDAFQKGGISGAMAEFGTILSDGIAMITDMLPDAINAGMELLGAVGQGILDNLPMILDAAKQILLMLGQGIMNAMPSLLKGAMQIIKSLGEFLVTNAPLLLTSIIEIVTEIANMLTANSEQLVDGAIALLMGLAKAFIDGLPILLPALLKLATSIAIALVENLPVIIQSLIEMAVVLAQTIVEMTPQFLNACVQVLMAIVNLIVEYGGQFLASAGEVFGNLINSVGEWMGGLIESISTWLSQLPTQMAYWAGFAIASFIKFFMDLPENLKTWFNETKQKAVEFGTELKNEAYNTGRNFFNSLIDNIKKLPERLRALGNSLVSAVASLPSKFTEVGKNIVSGLWNGIQEKWQWLKDKVSELANSLLQGAKDALGIESPSKEFAYVGRMVDEGFAKGLDNFSYLIGDAMDMITGDMLNVTPQVALADGVAPTTAPAYNQTVNIYSPTALTPSEVARQTRNATRDMVLQFRGK
jgi:TP901 family phage tail tape measure protein